MKRVTVSVLLLIVELTTRADPVDELGRELAAHLDAGRWSELFKHWSRADGHHRRMASMFSPPRLRAPTEAMAG